MRTLIDLPVLLAACVVGNYAAADTRGPDPPGTQLDHIVRVANLNGGPHPCRRIRLATPPSRHLATHPTLVAVLQLAQRLAQLDTSIEHGAILYRNPDGIVRTGPIVAGDGNSLSLNISPLPGETIVAAVHTHTRYPYFTVDQSRLSAEDVALGTQLLALPRTDRGLLLYIIDNATQTLTEYAASGRCKQERTTVMR
ncbi:MAG TPA: hypothetical protein VFT37_15145 [Telluria sp.]|nr:hypothetical protein [Telluria sp.]